MYRGVGRVCPLPLPVPHHIPQHKHTTHTYSVPLLMIDFSLGISKVLKFLRLEAYTFQGNHVNSSCPPSGAWPSGAHSLVLELKGMTRTFDHCCGVHTGMT